MTSPLPFSTRLAAAVRRTGTPLMVGLDPRFESLPRVLQLQQERVSFAEAAEAYRAFCLLVIDVVADLVPIVKPQAAFFEALGPAGMDALSEVFRAEGYSGEHSAWGADAVTESPYLGEDRL